MRNIFWSLLAITFCLDIFRRNIFEKNSQSNIEEKEKVNTPEEIKFTPPVITKIEEESTDLIKKSETQIPDEDLEKVTIDIKYCANSHAKQFEEVKKELMGSYTNINVTGSEFPINSIKKILSKGLFFLQMAMMVILVGGQTVRSYLTFIPDRVFTLIEEKKFWVGIMNFFVFNQISNFLNTSGAFEITMNGETVKI